jgi:hypothetical protein
MGISEECRHHAHPSLKKHQSLVLLQAWLHNAV